MTKTAGWIKGEQVGRNDRCPCGSGKKYKLCHLALERQLRLQSKQVERINKARVEAAARAAAGIQ